MKFAIVEDNPSTRMTVKFAVQKMGYPVVAEAENYEEAIKMIKESDFDVLLLDILIPGGSGMEVIRNSNMKGKKIIAITALEQNSIDKELLKLGVCYILKKPFSYSELEDAIKKCL
jgi:DNA-binding response OmpR family regulator